MASKREMRTKPATKPESYVVDTEIGSIGVLAKSEAQAAFFAKQRINLARNRSLNCYIEIGVIRRVLEFSRGTRVARPDGTFFRVKETAKSSSTPEVATASSAPEPPQPQQRDLFR